MPKITKRIYDFDESINDFMIHCTNKDLTKKTMKPYEGTLKLFAKYLEEEKQIMDINKINKNILEEYISFTKERGKYSFVASKEGMIKANIDKSSDRGKEVSNSILNNYLRNIKAFFSYLVDNQIIVRSQVVYKQKKNGLLMLQ